MTYRGCVARVTGCSPIATEAWTTFVSAFRSRDYVAPAGRALPHLDDLREVSAVPP